MTECDRSFPTGSNITAAVGGPVPRCGCVYGYVGLGKRHLTEGRDDVAMVFSLQHEACRAIGGDPDRWYCENGRHDK